MKNILDKLNKFVMFAIYLLLIVTMINGCNGCSSQKENVKMRKEVDSLNATVLLLKAQTYTKKELDIRLEILTLEEEKSTLFNVNYIVLTKERPDIRMNAIDQKIKALQEKLLQSK